MPKITEHDIAEAFGLPADALPLPPGSYRRHQASVAEFAERCEQAKNDALRAPLLTDEEKAAYRSAVAAVAARDEAQRTPQGDLLEGEQG